MGEISMFYAARESIRMNGNHNYFFKDQAKQNKKAATVKQTKKRKLLTTVLPALILLFLEFSKESWYRRTKSRTSL